jgi:hypothetical protein
MASTRRRCDERNLSLQPTIKACTFMAAESIAAIVMFWI